MTTTTERMTCRRCGGPTAIGGTLCDDCSGLEGRHHVPAAGAVAELGQIRREQKSARDVRRQERSEARAEIQRQEIEERRRLAAMDDAGRARAAMEDRARVLRQVLGFTRGTDQQRAELAQIEAHLAG